MREQFVSELLTEPIPLFLSKWMLERNTPYLFDSDHLSYLNWKAQLALRLGIDPCSILFIGTASIGISLNPNKNLKAFDAESDIDIAVISPWHFEESWRFLRSLGATRFQYSILQQASIKAHVTNYIYWGTIATDKILPILPFGKVWQLALNDMSKIPPTVGRTINLRIYKDFEALRGYHAHNLSRMREELLQSMKGES